MYNLQDIANEYRRLDQILNVDTSNIDLVHFTGVSQCGYCSVCGEKSIKIGINDLVFECPENEFYNVIRHEYAHAVDAIKYKNRGHSKTWEQICKIVGCIPSTHIPKNSELQKKFEQYNMQTAKYKITCSHCGEVYYYQRKSSIVNAYYAGAKLKCPVCHKKFSINTNKENIS